MSGTREGGLKAAKTNKEKHGEDFYVRAGQKTKEAWERNGRKPRGFAARPELARVAGAKGGSISKRTRQS